MDMLARRLGRQRLAHTRRTEEINDETLSLALDEVVEAEICVVSVDERAQQVLSVCCEDEALERLVVPHDGLDVGNVELHYVCREYA